MSLRQLPRELQKEIIDFKILIVNGKLATLHVHPTLLQTIKEEQSKDKKLVEIAYEVIKEKWEDYTIAKDGTLMVEGRICVPDNDDLKFQLLEEAHQTPYSIHPGTTKMYHDLKERYWWPGMKRDVIGYVERCLTCQQVKAEHQ